MTYDAVAASLKSARNLKALNEAAQQIQHVNDVNDMERLNAIYKRRRDELK